MLRILVVFFILYIFGKKDYDAEQARLRAAGHDND
jgi:hypothetical protein